jgi:hypothetical protein
LADPRSKWVPALSKVGGEVPGLFPVRPASRTGRHRRCRTCGQTSAPHPSQPLTSAALLGFSVRSAPPNGRAFRSETARSWLRTDATSPPPAPFASLGADQAQLTPDPGSTCRTVGGSVDPGVTAMRAMRRKNGTAPEYGSVWLRAGVPERGRHVRLGGFVASVPVKVLLVSDRNALPFGGAGRTEKLRRAADVSGWLG